LLLGYEIDLQQLLKIALKYNGYTVETTNNGIESLSKLETLKPDLIILDINTQQMVELDFYKKIS
jgi:CheY-like chemotaxis protein